MLISLLCFVGCFQLFIAGISYVYPVEVCTDSGASFALAVLFSTMIILGYVSPSIMSSPMGIEGLFFLYVGINVLCLIFCWIFMKETNGLTLKQLNELYLPKNRKI